MPSQFEEQEDRNLLIAAWELAVQAVRTAMAQRLLLRHGEDGTAESLLHAAGRSHEGRGLVERTMYGHGIPPALWWRAPNGSFEVVPHDYVPSVNPLDRIYGWELDPWGRLVRKRPGSRRASA